MREVITTVCDHLSATYGRPSGTVDGYAEILERVLRDYSDAQVKAALETVAAEFVVSDRERWPVPARFKRAIEGKAAPARAKKQVFNSFMDNSTQAKIAAMNDRARAAAVAAIVSTAIGHVAIREGWVREIKSWLVQLFRAAEITGKSPPDIDDIVARMPADTRRPHDDPGHEALCALGVEHKTLIDSVLAGEVQS